MTKQKFVLHDLNGLGDGEDGDSSSSRHRQASIYA